MREETCCHQYILPYYQQGTFYMYHPIDTIAHTTTSVEHSLEREIAQWVHHEGLIQQSIAPWEDTLPQSFISLPLLDYIQIYDDNYDRTKQKLWEIISNRTKFYIFLDAWYICNTECPQHEYPHNLLLFFKPFQLLLDKLRQNVAS